MRTYNTETERIIVSGLLNKPEMVDRILSMFTVDDFYLEIHRDIFLTAQKLRTEKRGVDVYVIHERLKDKYQFTQLTFIEDAAFAAFHDSLLDSYREAMREQRRERELVKAVYTAYETINGANENFPLNPKEVIATLRQQLHDISLSGTPMAEDAISQLVRYNEQLCEKEVKDRIHCPMWAHLDEGILWQNKTLNAVAARPGGGKSSFLIQLFTHLADQNERGMYFSVEVKHKAFFDRMASCLTQIPKWRFRDRKATPDERKEAIDRLSEVLGHVQMRFKEKDHEITLDSIASDLYRFQQEHGRVDFFIVDYLQIIDLSEFKFKKRYETLKAAAEFLRDMADSLNCVCLIGVQVGREYEKQMSRDNRMIMLSDFRESGDIENTVDTAIGLNVIVGKPEMDKMTVQIMKNREGQSGLMVAFEHDKVRNFWIDHKIVDTKDEAK